MNTYTFFISSLIVILLPGTGVIYTISTGISNGKRESIVAALGCTAGIIPHLIISICLSSLILKMNNTAFLILKIIGSLYLIYLGIGMMLSKTKFQINKTTNENKSLVILYKAILINLLNPKLTLFFFSFLPQYIGYGDTNYMLHSFVLGLAFMIITFVVFAVYGLLAGFIRSVLVNSPSKMYRIQQIFGIIFIVFAINLSLSSV